MSDHINHHLLITKFERYDFCGNTASLIQSYLRHRIQLVRVDGYRSHLLPVGYGVPQRRILACLLFIFYLNDVDSVATAAKFIIYADDDIIYDDAGIFLAGTPVDELIYFANLASLRLEEWTRKNNFKISLTKTKAALFRAKNKRVDKTVTSHTTPVDI